MKGVSEKMYRKICPICNVSFVARRKDARYDGPACRQIASRLSRWYAKEKLAQNATQKEGVKHD